MDKRIKENIRVKRQIALAFLKLLKSDDITDSEIITISQITSTAKVSRMAYYRNFQSKTEIIDYYLSETLWKELNDTLSTDFEFWSLDYGIAFFNLMKCHRDDILLLNQLRWLLLFLLYIVLPSHAMLRNSRCMADGLNIGLHNQVPVVLKIVRILLLLCHNMYP